MLRQTLDMTVTQQTSPSVETLLRLAFYPTFTEYLLMLWQMFDMTVAQWPLPMLKPFSIWLLPTFHKIPVDARYDGGPTTSPNVKTLLHLAFTQFSWNTCWCCDRRSLWLAQQTSPNVKTLLHLAFTQFSWNTCWCCDRRSIWLAQQTSPSVETLLHLFFFFLNPWNTYWCCDRHVVWSWPGSRGPSSQGAGRWTVQQHSCMSGSHPEQHRTCTTVKHQKM